MQRTGGVGWFGRVSALVSEAWRLQSYGVRVVLTNDGGAVGQLYTSAGSGPAGSFDCLAGVALQGRTNHRGGLPTSPRRLFSVCAETIVSRERQPVVFDLSPQDLDQV